MTTLIVCGCVYAMGWAALYRILSRTGGARWEPDEDEDDEWATAALWPVILALSLVVLIAMGYQWLDTALKREGV